MLRPKLPLAFSLLCLILVLLGVFFRFAYLDQKVFWNDEVYSTVPVLGHRVEEITREWLQRSAEGFVTAGEAWQRYQSFAPGATMGSTLASLAQEEPQNSPLYFVLSHIWLASTGDTTLGMRSLAALISLLSLPAVYFLCQELFQSGAIAWLGVGLTAVSPLHIIYAQEARQYSLLIVATLVSSWLLLRALRLHHGFSWLIYSVSVAVGLYAQPFFGFVAIAHAVYTFLLEPISLKRFRPYLSATGLGFLLYAPWLWWIVTGLDRISPWRGRTDLPLPQLLGRWLLNLARTFGDFPGGQQSLYDLRLHPLNPMLYLTVLVVGLVGYGGWYLIGTTERKTWLFLVTLTIFPAIFLVGADLLLGGIRSTIPRYLLPSYLGVQLVVAGLLGKKWMEGRSFLSSSRKYSRRWIGLGALILTLGCVSCALMVPRQTWWSKYSNYYDPAIVQLIHQSEQAIVISESALRLLSLSYLLQPDTILHLGEETAPPPLSRFPAAADIYIYDARASATRLKEQLEAASDRRFELVFREPFGFIDGHMQLWKLQRES